MQFSFDQNPSTEKLQGFSKLFYGMMLSFVEEEAVLIATKIDRDDEFYEYVFNIKKLEDGDFAVVSGYGEGEAEYSLEILFDENINCWFFDLDCISPNSERIICIHEEREVEIPLSVMRMFYWDGLSDTKQLTPGEVFERMYCEDGELKPLDITVKIAC